jgi:hypothetical protein
MKQILALFLTLLLAGFAFAASANTAASRTFEKTLSATGIAKLKLGNPVGSVHIKTGNAGAIKVRIKARHGGHVHFIFDWTWGDEPAHGVPKDLHLVSKRRGKTLTLCLVSKHENGCQVETKGHTRTVVPTSSSGHHRIVIGSHHHGWKADWTVVVPARLAVNLQLGVGDAKVKGVAGGLKSRIGVGHITAKLPHGPIDTHVGVGHIEADVGASDYGKVKLTAGVGHVNFEVNGDEVKTGYQHSFTSSEQSLTGSGSTAYTLEAGVGHVQLKLGVAGLHNMPVPTTTPASTSAPTSGAPATSAPAASTHE